MSDSAGSLGQEGLGAGRLEADPVLVVHPGVSGADVAETTFTCFAHTKSRLTVRLIVRRVRPTPGSQLALFTSYDHHAFVTDREGDVLETEADHRRHAVVEQTIAELKSAGPAHLPSDRFTANAAWLALAVVARNLGHAIGILAGHDLPRATAATLERTLFTSQGAWSTPLGDCDYDFPCDGRGPRHTPKPSRPSPRCLNGAEHHPRPYDPRTFASIRQEPWQQSALPRPRY
ncbi:hypothetical protein ACFYYI_29350 [Streptomyces sp. NPDC002387]|uniref:hypothetical protein n=1 Tax=Streptomyces sp. NPDC002387 TaxID=3364643 RepID=UPI0036B13D57